MQIIIGKCPSKSNCYKIIQQRGKDGKYHGSLAKKDALVMYEKSFYLQCSQYRNKQIKGLFELYLSVHYDTQRPDLDNCLKIVLDCLQSCRAIRNGEYVVEDTKGVRTKEYIIKRKLMLYVHGIRIKEV